MEDKAAVPRASPPGRKRLAVVLSVLVYIIAGVPFWWKLTEVYRAPLPFLDVEAFANQVSSGGLALPCSLQIVFSSKETSLDNHAWSLRLETFRESLQQRIGTWDDCCGHDLDLVVTLDTESLCIRKEGRENTTYWRCGLSGSEMFSLSSDGIDEALRNYILSEELGNKWQASKAGLYTIVIFLDGGHTLADAQAVVGKYRHAWITGPSVEASLNDNELMTLISETATTMLRGGARNSIEQKAQLMPLAADGTAILSFTLLNANPEDWMFDWDFEQLEERFLSPVVDMLAPVAKLTVESQVLYYTPRQARSQWDAELRSYVIDSKEVSFFVNANEWHVDTSTAAAGRSKVLHFAIYVPAASDCPLHFRLPSGRISPTDGFTSPGWGGVIVWNPSDCVLVDENISLQRLNVKDLELTMGTVVAQLRTLFGLPPLVAPKRRPKISSIPNLITGFAEWELDILLRRRAIADVNASASTLASLSRLVKSLPNMVIQDEIGVQVKTSLKAVKEATKNQTAPYTVTAEAARNARAWAEAAFFHPSIMSLLHFPKEHQFAIYTPFFVPVLLHTLVSVVKETRRYLKEQKRYQIAHDLHT